MNAFPFRRPTFVPVILGLGVALSVVQLGSLTTGPVPCLLVSLALLGGYGILSRMKSNATDKREAWGLLGMFAVVLTGCAFAGGSQIQIAAALSWCGLMTGAGILLVGWIQTMAADVPVTNGKVSVHTEAFHEGPTILATEPFVLDSAASGPPEPAWPGAEPEFLHDAESIEAGDELVLQHWTRIAAADGERLEGTVQVVFQENQRQAYLHIPFSPAFSSLPEGWCESVTDTCFSGTFDALRAYGARLIVRRSGPVNQQALAEFEIAICAQPAQARAA